MNSDQAFDVIEQIRLSGGHAKMAILKKYPEMKPFLVAAYNPYVMYHNTKANPGYGTCGFDARTWSMLEELSSRKLTGMRAQTTINLHMQDLSNTSAELFHRIINKDLRMGMGAKSINKVFPGLIPIHAIMKAKLYDANHVEYPCYGSPKMDGVRAKFKNGLFYSSGGHPYKGLELLQELLHDVTVEIDTELTVFNKSFQVGSGLIRSDDPTPDAQMHILELPTIKESFNTRLNMMEDMFHGLNNPSICSVPRSALYDEYEVQEYYKNCRRLHFEGSIISPYDYEYVGSRSYRWMKLKPVKDIDTKVIDIYEGKGKYKGQLGGVVVMFKGKRNRVGGGFSDKQRKDFYEHPEFSFFISGNSVPKNKKSPSKAVHCF